MSIVKLNLPEYDYKLKKEQNVLYIYDPIRRKYIQLTPEEWVRQHFINYLTSDLQYPKSLIRVESGLTYNRLQKRTDIVLYNREGLPHIIIECKSFEINVSVKTLLQLSAYQSGLRANYFALTNGFDHFFYKSDPEPEQIAELPLYQK